jgi:hypothetical protein
MTDLHPPFPERTTLRGDLVHKPPPGLTVIDNGFVVTADGETAIYQFVGYDNANNIYDARLKP